MLSRVVVRCWYDIALTRPHKNKSRDNRLGEIADHGAFSSNPAVREETISSLALLENRRGNRLVVAISHRWNWNVA